MQAIILLAICFVIGGLLPVQGGLNAQLAPYLKHPMQAALVSFIVGSALLLAFLLMVRTDWPSWAEWRRIPWQLFLGGSIGAAFVASVLYMAPKIGMANVLAAGIAGQLIVSLLIDHYGWFGIPAQPLALSRIAGAFLLLAGLWLVQRG